LHRIKDDAANHHRKLMMLSKKQCCDKLLGAFLFTVLRFLELQEFRAEGICDTSFEQLVLGDCTAEVLRGPIVQLIQTRLASISGSQSGGPALVPISFPSIVEETHARETFELMHKAQQLLPKAQRSKTAWSQDNDLMLSMALAEGVQRDLQEILEQPMALSTSLRNAVLEADRVSHERSNREDTLISHVQSVVKAIQNQLPCRYLQSCSANMVYTPSLEVSAPRAGQGSLNEHILREAHLSIEKTLLKENQDSCGFADFEDLVELQRSMEILLNPSMSLNEKAWCRVDKDVCLRSFQELCEAVRKCGCLDRNYRSHFHVGDAVCFQVWNSVTVAAVHDDDTCDLRMPEDKIRYSVPASAISLKQNRVQVFMELLGKLQRIPLEMARRMKCPHDASDEVRRMTGEVMRDVLRHCGSMRKAVYASALFSREGRFREVFRGLEMDDDEDDWPYLHMYQRLREARDSGGDEREMGRRRRLRHDRMRDRQQIEEFMHDFTRDEDTRHVLREMMHHLRSENTIMDSHEAFDLEEAVEQERGEAEFPTTSSKDSSPNHGDDGGEILEALMRQLLRSLGAEPASSQSDSSSSTSNAATDGR
jgi:hypothetical protein